MEFIKTSTAFRKVKSNLKFSFLDFDELDLTWSDIYDGGIQLASWMIRRNWTMMPTAIIGRLNKFSSAAFVSIENFELKFSIKLNTFNIILAYSILC